MKKNVLLIIMFLLFISVSAKGLTEIESIQLGRAKMIFTIKGSSVPERIVTYDEETRMIFFEFENSVPGPNIKASRQVNGSYIEKIESLKYDTSTDFFVTLKKDVTYREKILTNPTRLVIYFGKDEGKKYNIVIDPGHGGKDPGAVGYGGLKEKDIVYQIAERLQKKLDKKYNVIMTRSKSEFISLKERADIGNVEEADLFISLHANASKSKAARGAEVFYFSRKGSDYAKSIAQFENSVDEKFGIKDDYAELIVNDIFYHINQEKSIPLSAAVTKKISAAAGLKNRGYYGANFAVLRGSNCPAILVEVGFITNKTDASRLKSSTYQEKIATAIYSAVNNFFN